MNPLNISRQTPKMLPYNIQKLVDWFLFFLAFPSLVVAGNSVTFYIFIVIIFKVGIFWVRPFFGKKLFFSFLLVVVLSTISGLYINVARHPGFFYSIQIVIQYIYWILLAAFMIVYGRRIDFLRSSKWIFYGTIASILGFYVLPFKLDSNAFSIITNTTRNSFVFSLLCTIPICFYYLHDRYGKSRLIYFFFIFTISMFLTNGRSGSVIILLQLLLVSSIIYPFLRKGIKIALIPLCFIFFLSQSEAVQPYLDGIASQVESINPRFANLLRAEGDGDLTRDKSWLIRKLMIDKGFEIVQKYPFIGIGANNFKYYDSELATFGGYERLNYLSTSLFNSLSAHNSYVQILAEFGFVGFGLFIIILIKPLLVFIRRVLIGGLTMFDLSIISLFGICLHFYAIASITGAIPWFIIGLSWTASQTKK